MSKYASPFVKDFMSRTNSVIQEYSGEYDATILLNCLLGMVVIPFEMHRDAFESEWLERKIEDFLEEIKSKGRYLDHGKKNSAYSVVRHLRNAIAHGHIKPVHQDELVWGFLFTTFASNKMCDLTGEHCYYKNEISTNAPKVFTLELSIEEIKRISSIIDEFVANL